MPKSTKIIQRTSYYHGRYERNHGYHPSIDEFCEYDFQFHTKIITYLENEQFSSIFSTFMYRMKALAKLSLSHKGRMENTYNEHMAILNALESGDSEHIYEITIAHMERPKESTLRIYNFPVPYF